MKVFNVKTLAVAENLRKIAQLAAAAFVKPLFPNILLSPLSVYSTKLTPFWIKILHNQSR